MPIAQPPSMMKNRLRNGRIQCSRKFPMNVQVQTGVVPNAKALDSGRRCHTAPRKKARSIANHWYGVPLIK